MTVNGVHKWGMREKGDTISHVTGWQGTTTLSGLSGVTLTQTGLTRLSVTRSSHGENKKLPRFAYGKITPRFRKSRGARTFIFNGVAYPTKDTSMLELLVGIVVTCIIVWLFAYFLPQ